MPKEPYQSGALSFATNATRWGTSARKIKIHPHNHMGSEEKEEKTKGEKKMWIASAIAKVMKDVKNASKVQRKLGNK